MRKWTVKILPDAENDIEDIYTYMADELLEPLTAAKIIARIKEAIHKLDQMPERYRLYEKEPWRSKGLRLFSVGNYIVFITLHQNLILYMLMQSCTDLAI